MSSRISGKKTLHFYLHKGIVLTDNQFEQKLNIDLDNIKLYYQQNSPFLYLHTHPHCAGDCRQSDLADAEQGRAEEPGLRCEALVQTHRGKYMH